MTDPGFVLFVFLTAGAGVLIDAPVTGGDGFLVTGCWFWHGRFLKLLYYNYSYAHKCLKPCYPGTPCS